MRPPSPASLDAADRIFAEAGRAAEVVEVEDAKTQTADQRECIGLLRAALARAEAGEVVGVAIIEARRDRCVGTSFCTGSGWANLVAGTAAVQHRLLSEG